MGFAAQRLMLPEPSEQVKTLLNPKFQIFGKPANVRYYVATAQTKINYLRHLGLELHCLHELVLKTVIRLVLGVTVT
jgi:hypothetical protein